MSYSRDLALLEEVRFNAAALRSPQSLFIKFNTKNVKNIRTLVDSGASESFIDSRFAIDNRFPLQNLKKPLRLKFLNGSSATQSLIIQSTTLDIQFPCGTQHRVRFYLTPLDPDVSAVLGYSWLTEYDPSIKWSKHEITIRPLEPLSPSVLRASPELSSPTPHPDASDSLSDSGIPDPEPSASLRAAAAKIPVSVITARAVGLLSRLPSSHPLSIVCTGFIRRASAPARSASAATAPPDPALVAELDELRPKIPDAYHDFVDVFSKSKGTTLPPRRSYDHKIEIDAGTSPPYGPIYSLSEVEQLALREFLSENLANHFIRPSQSSAGAPILFIRKKDGSLRLAVDYRGLNRITKKDRYPLPLIPDLLDRLRSANVYTKIDLRGAYNLVRIAEGDEWKTAFRTRYGSYEFQVMHYGLTNAPASFQRFMNDTFKELLDVCVVVYLDDILIYSENSTDHTAHVREVLRRLREANLFAKIEKCEFDVDTTEFLGFVISPDGIHMSESKVKVIQDWPIPRRVKDVQSFLGFANFYRRFIVNYSDMTVPLTRLTHKKMPWNWTTACQEAFALLKRAFTSAPILWHFDPALYPIVETDASDYAIAGIFSLRNEDGDVHPVAFYSRTLTGAELNYDTHDKELLAIFEAFKGWRHYLESPHHVIDVVTDHKNLEYFSSTKVLSRRQARWSEYLSAFNMVVRFRPGKLGEKPDSLTRRADYYLKGGDRDFTLANPQNLRPVFSQENLATSLRATRLQDIALNAAALVDISIPIIDTAALVEDIKVGLTVDPVAKREFDLCTQGSPSPGFSLSSSGLLLLHRRVYVPDYRPEQGNLRTRVLQEKHNHLTAGHFGFNKTLELIRRDYTWPLVRTDCKNFVSQCVLCARNKPSRHRPYGLLQPLPIPERPWHSVSMDFIEQLPTSNGFTAILVVIDRLTKESVFIPTTDNATAVDVADAFVTHVFAKHGIPLHVSSDRGSEFTSHFFQSLGALLRMRLHFTSGHHPSANGQVERVNSTLEQYLRIYCNYQQDNWSKLLPLAEFAYNNAPHSTTGVSPFFANRGYDPLIAIHPDAEITDLRARHYAINFDEIHSFLRDRMKDAQEVMSRTANQHRMQAPPFHVGDRVYVRTDHIRTNRAARKLAEQKIGPFPIVSQPSASSFTLRLPATIRIHPVFHVSQLEPEDPNTFQDREQPPPPPLIVDGKPEYLIERIIDSKYNRTRRRCQLSYHVKWVGYPISNNSSDWILATAFDDDAGKPLAEAYHDQQPQKPGPEKIAKDWERRNNVQA